MKLNRTIPGQMTDAELYRLSQLANRVPRGGIIVEVGCLYGLASYHISKASQPDVTVFCIDPWERVDWVIDLVEKPQGAPPFSAEAFAYYTRECSNIVMIKGFSPECARGWQLGVDLYIEDAVHQNPTLSKNIKFWTSKIVRGGLAAGHDYCETYPDVISEVDSLAGSWNSAISLVDTLWSLQKP